MVFLEGRLSSLDPLLNDLAMHIDKDKTLVIVVILFLDRFGLLVQLVLAWLLRHFTWRILEVLYHWLNLAIANLELNFEDVDNFLALQRGDALALEHGWCWELTLSDIGNFTHWDDNCRLLREATESNVILVHEETVWVQDKVPFDEVVVLVDEFAKSSFMNDATFNIWFSWSWLDNLALLIVGHFIIRVGETRIHILQVVDVVLILRSSHTWSVIAYIIWLIFRALITSVMRDNSVGSFVLVLSFRLLLYCIDFWFGLIDCWLDFLLLERMLLGALIWALDGDLRCDSANFILRLFHRIFL